MTDSLRDPGPLSPRVVNEIDPDLLDFLRGKVNTFLKWDLVRFFHDNPHTADTAENIARYVGRDLLAVANELGELAKDGLLKTQSLGDLAIYSLTDAAAARGLIHRFVTAIEDRQFRVKAMYHVIRGSH